MPVQRWTRRALAAALVVLVLATGAVGAWLVLNARAKPSGIDPQAPIDPARKYHLVVWDYRLPYSSPGGAPFSDSAAEAIRRFERRHPNVTVDLHLVDPSAGPADLAAALTAGYPPDVYCSPFGLPATGSDLQVPIGLYLDFETWSDYHPVAWQTVQVGGTLWAWPRYLLLWPWLGNAVLLREAGVDPGSVAVSGWTREEFAAAASRLAAKGGSRGPSALASTSPALVVRDLLLSTSLAGSDGESEGAAEVLRWLGGLQEAEALRPLNSETSSTVLSSFVSGRSAVLAGPSPWATLFLLETVERTDPWQFSIPNRDNRPPMVLLPPPHGEGEPSTVWVSAATVAVFRQARYRGDDNTRLAVELARELSQGTRPWLRDQFLCVPASQSEIASWRMRCLRFGEAGVFAVRAFDQLASLPADRLNSVLASLDYGRWADELGNQPADTGAVAGTRNPAGLVGPGYLGPLLRDVVAPLAMKLWNGEMSPEEAIAELADKWRPNPAPEDSTSRTP